MLYYIPNSPVFLQKALLFFKQEENTVRKGEIAHYEQFFLFLQCFQKTSSADMLKPKLVWETVKLDQSEILSFVNAFENIVRKGEKA